MLLRPATAPLFAAFVCAALAVGCTDRAPAPAASKAAPAPTKAATATPTPAATRPPPASSRPDWKAIVAAEEACADCHPDEVEAWRASPMGRSMGRMDAGFTITPATADVKHPKTDERFGLRTATGALTFTRGPDIERTATHVVGSGAHTRSFLRVVDGVAAIMPLTWYASRSDWDLSPGYDVADHPGFHRRVNLECLVCHGDPAAVAPGTDDVFVEPLPGAIGCSRCHGDGRAHVTARMAGGDAPLVNPAKLEPGAGADVCGQCHLQGAVRRLRTGRAWDEFMPGQRLGDTVAVFVRSTPGAEFGIASQAERLGRSACATADPEARRCTTCHAPHPTGPKTDRSAACRDCHGGSAKQHACAGEGGPDCAGCHMVRRATSDIPHVAMTDHFIRVRPVDEARPAGDTGDLTWVNRPPGVADTEAALMLGRAYAEAARAGGGSADRARAIELLEPAVAAHPNDGNAWADLASMKRISGSAAGARSALERAVGLQGARAAWWSSLARLHLLTGDVDAAEAALGRAKGLRTDDPDDALTEARLALTRGDAQRFERALGVFENARPGRAETHLIRGTMALTALNGAAAETAFARATKAQPGSAQAWLTLCRHRADRRQWDAADVACTTGAALARGEAAVGRFAAARARVALGRGDTKTAAELAAAGMQSAPFDAMLVLGRLAADAGRLDDALKLLDKAVTMEPTSAEGWATLARILRARGETELADRAAAQARRISGGP